MNEPDVDQVEPEFILRSGFEEPDFYIGFDEQEGDVSAEQESESEERPNDDPARAEFDQANEALMRLIEEYHRRGGSAMDESVLEA